MRFLPIVRGDARPAAEWRMVGGPPDPRSPVRRTTSDKVDMVGEFFWKLCGGGARAGISRPCRAGIQLAAAMSRRRWNFRSRDRPISTVSDMSVPNSGPLRGTG